MKKYTLNSVKIGMFAAFFLVVSAITYGQVTYTAIASGNWSSSATWSGGSVPPFIISSNDQITINSGVTVTMDQNVILNNASAYINVAGSLTGAAHVKLNITSGSLQGSGNITAAQVSLTSAGALTFYSGSITADTLSNFIVGLSLGAQVMVNDALILSQGLSVDLGGSLQMGSNSSIIISNGNIAVSGGSLTLTSNYNVEYNTNSITTGMELSGSGLGKVTVNVSNGNSVTLSSDIIMSDSLRFKSGELMLNGYSLTTSGQISGNVMLGGNASSNLTINTAGGLSSSIMFKAGSQNLNNLTINVGSGNDSVKIRSALTVGGNLAFTSSGKLDIKGANLTLAGDVTGTSTIVVNGGTKLAFTGSGSITGNINLAGTTMSKFTVNVGTGNTLTLGSDLNVDTLAMISGGLVLNSHNISISGDVAASGAGIIISTPHSNLTVSASAALTGALMFSATGDTLNNLMVDVGSGGSFKLGSNVVIDGMVSFTNGYIDVGNNNLNIGASGSISGAGSSSYVITSGSGNLIMEASISNATTFEVGTSTKYLPAKITLNGGSSTGTIGVNVSAGVYAHGTTGVMISSSQPMVDATWLFQNNIGAGINANMQLSWSASAEVNAFAHTDDYISHYVSGVWDDIGDSMTATLSGSLYSVTRANITSMSPFAVFDQKTVSTGIDEIANYDNDFEVYPNPVSNSLYIKNELGTSTGLINVEIYNTLGQMVSTFELTNSITSIPVDRLSSGTYLIKCYNDKMQVVKKFSKL